MYKILLLAAALTATLAAPVTVGQCVSDCTGVANGDYQSCNGCQVYVSCSDGVTYDNRPCPADLYWDDSAKDCEWQSTTCTSAAVITPVAVGQCVSVCTGVQDGNYQSCNGCHVYVTCSHGMTYDNRSCPAKFSWDDTKKKCAHKSTTC